MFFNHVQRLYFAESEAINNLTIHLAIDNF